MTMRVLGDRDFGPVPQAACAIILAFAAGVLIGILLSGVFTLS